MPKNDSHPDASIDDGEHPALRSADSALSSLQYSTPGHDIADDDVRLDELDDLTGGSTLGGAGVLNVPTTGADSPFAFRAMMVNEYRVEKSNPQNRAESLVAKAFESKSTLIGLLLGLFTSTDADAACGALNAINASALRVVLFVADDDTSPMEIEGVPFTILKGTIDAASRTVSLTRICSE